MPPPDSPAVPTTPVRQCLSRIERSSPRTPSSAASTPYTALSPGRRSLASSTPTTPSSVTLAQTPHRKARPRKSIADLTDNWRVRAQLNGIKVSNTSNDETLKKVSSSPNEFSLSFRRSPSAYVSPESTGRFTSCFNTPSPNASDTKYSPGAFSSRSHRHALYDSPCSDVSEDEDEDSSSHQPSVARVFRDLPSFESQQAPSRSSCSVCDKETSALSRMIVLSPCSHVFCSSCFTGTLNIVDEKSMSCMKCHAQVVNFHFALPGVSSPEAVSPTDILGDPFKESPAGVSKTSLSHAVRDSLAVLRIDNVPWDVTPTAIQNFIQHPICRAHILLDIKGKTLSHAFVQLTHENARAALRTSQNAVLGRGRRARAATVTLSSQEELMGAVRNLFLSISIHAFTWRGSFDGLQPSLDGLENQKVNDALQHGLISKAEIKSLFSLITNPDSHFLKVPSLPFYSIISILSTFPADTDSRVFWTVHLREALFSLVLEAFNILASRKRHAEDIELWDELASVSTRCQVFTTSQIFRLRLVSNKTNVVESKDLLNLHGGSLESTENLTGRFGLEPGVLMAIRQPFS